MKWPQGNTAQRVSGFSGCIRLPGGGVVTPERGLLLPAPHFGGKIDTEDWIPSQGTKAVDGPEPASSKEQFEQQDVAAMKPGLGEEGR